MRDAPEVFIWHVVHACMYGSKRLKKTGLLINFFAPNLQKLCDNGHKHLPWTHSETVDPETGRRVQVFDTASEAEYHRQFCEALAIAFTAELQSKGFSWRLEPPLQESAAYLANDKQPRGARGHAVIAEFKHLVQVTVQQLLTCRKPLHKTPKTLAGVPIGAKLVRFSIFRKRGSRML